MLRIVRLDKYDGYGFEVTLEFVLQQLALVENNYDVQLFSSDKIVKLDIPFSEVYHRCDEKEWSELIEYILKHFGI